MDEQVSLAQEWLKYSFNDRVSLGQRVGTACELVKFITKAMGSRRSLGKKKGMVVEIDEQWLLKEVARTRLRCAYSNVRMTIKSCSQFLCSIERKDPSQGYLCSNTVLVCHEFNHGNAQWSQALVDQFWGEIDEYPALPPLRYVHGNVQTMFGVTQHRRGVCECCTKQSSYNWTVGSPPRFCNDHRETGMINVRRKTCQMCGTTATSWRKEGPLLLETQEAGHGLAEGSHLP